MVSIKKSYTREFMIETVKLITSGGSSAPQVAKDFDIHLKTLYKWIQEFSPKPEEAFPCKGEVTSDAVLIRKLKRKNEQLTMECTALKKADPLSKAPN